MFCKIFTYTVILRLLVMENSMWVGHPEIIPMSKISIDTGRVITDAGEFGATDHSNSEIEGMFFRLELTSVSK